MLCSYGSGRIATECFIHLAAPVLLIPRHLTPPSRQHRWRHLEKDGLGTLRGISGSILALEERFGEVLPDFRGLSELFIASDYSGSKVDKKSKYEIFSFLIFPFHDAKTWHADRVRVRKQFFSDRSMSFKAMNDSKRRDALPHFLKAADSIPGLLATVAVSRQHRSLFQHARLDMGVEDLKGFRHWHRDVFEKLLRTTHILSFLLAGVSHPEQSFIWYSDNDDIAANRGRLRELGEVWRAAVVNIIPHHISSLTIGTEQDDDPSRSLADVLAVPDLACGAWCQLLSRAGASKFINAAPEVSAALETLSTPALTILEWFASPDRPLKRMLCVIDDPLPDRKVGYMCSIPPALDDFRESVKVLMSSRAV